MAKPQCEDGYTKIANELLEAMCRLHLSGNQWKVLHAVIRKTYGWNKKADWITATQIAELTSMYRSHVSSALRTLHRRKIIVREGRLIAVQKDYDAWQGLDNVTDSGNNGVGESVPKPVTECTDIGNKSVPKPVHTKDKRNYTKDIAEKRYPLAFLALADVCKVDLHKVSKRTERILFTASERFSDDDAQAMQDFADWWYKTDWRGQRGDVPRPEQVGDEWGKFRDYRHKREGAVKWQDQSRS